MKKQLVKGLEYGKQLVKRLLVLALFFCVASLLTPRGSYAQLALTLLAVLSMAGEIAVLLIYCRCPYCGKRLVLGALSVTICPRCHRNLATGKKSRKK